MLEAALRYLRELTNAAHSPILLLDEPARAAYYNPASGAFVDVQKEPAPRAHLVDTVDAMVAAAKLWNDGASILWVNSDAVRLVIDDATRRDLVTLPLRISMPLEAARKTHGLTQKALVWFLRHDLAGCVPPSLVALFRQIAFRRASDGAATIQHGRESLGRSVEAAVTATSEIPETILATIPIFTNDGARGPQAVAIDVDIDSENERFTLSPQPDAIEAAATRALAAIAARLVDELGPTWKDRVLMGRPFKS